MIAIARAAFRLFLVCLRIVFEILLIPLRIVVETKKFEEDWDRAYKILTGKR